MGEMQVVIVDPPPKNCYECPIYVSKSWGDLEDYCHLTGEVVWDSQYGKIIRSDCLLYNLERKPITNE